MILTDLVLCDNLMPQSGRALALLKHFGMVRSDLNANWYWIGFCQTSVSILSLIFIWTVIFFWVDYSRDCLRSCSTKVLMRVTLGSWVIVLRRSCRPSLTASLSNVTRWLRLWQLGWWILIGSKTCTGGAFWPRVWRSLLHLTGRWCRHFLEKSHLFAHRTAISTRIWVFCQTIAWIL